ncbi:hypothetical protein Q3G72_028882 [Acer saccharum]|nr:hypothetical protein Q3G72_028882 [Acer saccharum]
MLEVDDSVDEQRVARIGKAKKDLLMTALWRGEEDDESHKLVLKCDYIMELSEPVFVPNHDHQLTHPQLELQPPSPPSPDLDPPPSDLNHAAALQEDLQNLDLGEAEAEEKVENKDEECESDDTINDRNENENGNDNDNYDNDNNDNDSNNNSGSEIRKRYPFPVRPDAEDCAYYMKTGTCKFGSNCKFNHPVRRKNQAAKEKVKAREDSLERLGQGQSQSQIECKYYLRTGGCKFGKACRYNHTRAKSSVLPIFELNFLGLPIRTVRLISLYKAFDVSVLFCY